MFETIKEFLVGLSFGVDEKSLKKFNDSIKSATLRVTALATAVTTAAAGIVLGISKVSESFEKMGYEMRLISPAINRTIALRREMLKAYSAAGINLTKVIQDSVKLNFSLTKTKYAFEAIYKSVASKFFPLLTKQSDLLRAKLYANMPKILASLEKFVKFIFKAFEAVVILGTRLFSIFGRIYDFFVKLHDATHGFSTAILAAVAAWKLLNLSFLLTPLGAILTGLVALLALYDDFMTFQEGGESLFNWSAAIPTINAITSAISGMVGVISSLFSEITSVFKAFYALAHLDFSGFADNIANAFGFLGNVLSGVKGQLGSVIDIGKSIGNWVGGASNLASNPTAEPLTNPVGSSVQNSQTNQKVNQQTSIIVQGSSDANSTGRAVAAQQSRVNFDMVRNMKGATR